MKLKFTDNPRQIPCQIRVLINAFLRIEAVRIEAPEKRKAQPPCLKMDLPGRVRFSIFLGLRYAKMDLQKLGLGLVSGVQLQNVFVSMDFQKNKWTTVL